MSFKCIKKTGRGKRCQAYALTDSKYCYTHDPKRASERNRAHTLGGLRRQAAPRSGFPADCDLTTIEGLIKFGAAQIQETWKLSNTVGRARALSQMTHAQQKLIELEDLQARTAKLDQEERKRVLVRRIEEALFDDDYNPYEDAPEEELIKIYKETIERERLSWKDRAEEDRENREDEAGDEDQIVATTASQPAAATGDEPS